jgi:alkanesulfonate monooxygenase SsuD/methylene tetrahydromethanopterin reductase-like flavin-dependent oxidoreductase (luciferase family)
MSTRPRIQFGLAIDFGGAAGLLPSRLDAARCLAVLAEEHGFGSLWAGESYPTTSGDLHLPSPQLALSALSTSSSLRLVYDLDAASDGATVSGSARH